MSKATRAWNRATEDRQWKSRADRQPSHAPSATPATSPIPAAVTRSVGGSRLRRISAAPAVMVGACGDLRLRARS